MGRRSRFAIAQKSIETKLDSLNTNFFSYKELASIFEENRHIWKLPQSWYPSKFIEALQEAELLIFTQIEFPSTTHNRYIWGEEFELEGLATSIHPSAYISHYSAMAHLGLTDQVPKTLYVTVEQSSKPYKGQLKQTAIDAAFAKPQRKTTAIAEIGSGKEKIIIQKINGKFTNAIGVKKTEAVRRTNLERTLIDATVRPAYCGGVHEVMEAYRRAADKISINKLKGMLKKLDYTYPYHQAIGFYMEACGKYSEKQISQLQDFEMAYDFYLTYDMKEKEYSKRWRLYYPKNIRLASPL